MPSGKLSAKRAASNFQLSPLGGSATSEPASDYVSRFRGDGRQSAMSLPFRSAYVSTLRGPSRRRARSGHPRPCGAFPRLLIELSADRQ
jgi:hypothetical protein